MFDSSSDSNCRLQPIPDQEGFREALTGQMRGLQAVGVEELVEEVVPHIYVNF